MKTWMKVALVLGALAVFIAWMLVDAGRREGRMTATAEAVLTAVELYEDPESRSLDETRLRYRFAAGGRELEGADALPGDRRDDFRVGEEVTICFNPADPRETDVQTDPGARCGG
jgi:hypothetical protein